MALIQDGTTLRERINSAQPNTLIDKLALLLLGNVLATLITSLYTKVPVVGAPTTNYNLATVYVLVLPDFAKASKIERCYVRAGVATGEFTPVAYGVTPATTQCAVTPNGDIAFLLADAPTEVDIQYVPVKQDIYEVELPVVSGTGILTLPTTFGKVATLLEAEVTAGAVLGKKAILVPGAAPATTQARLNALKTQVLFNVATDVVTKARVKFGVAPRIDMQSKLMATADFG